MTNKKFVADFLEHSVYICLTMQTYTDTVVAAGIYPVNRLCPDYVTLKYA